MNLIITNTCNRACPYCFARSRVNLSDTQTGPKTQHISLDNYDKYLRFLESSKIPSLKLLGGEPTLHPDFFEMVSRGHQHGFEMLVFTNGLWPRRVQDAIRSVPLAEWKLKFLFNVNEPTLQSTAQLAHAKESMKLAGLQGSCGFNIYREEFDLQFVPNLIDEVGLDRGLRLGLASPIVGTDNSFLDGKSFKAIGIRLVEQLNLLEKRNVLASFDCGFPLCMFAEESLGSLVLNSRGFQSVCSYPIDVGPELMAWPCFPLSDCANVCMLDFQNAAELLAHYTSRLSGIRRMGIYEKCLTCKFIERGQCCGGCVARTIKDWATKGDADILGKLGWT